MKTKTFDCVEMKRQAAARIHEATRDMTLEQKIEYWRRRSEVFRQEQQQAVREQERTDEGGSEVPDAKR